MDAKGFQVFIDKKLIEEFRAFKEVIILFLDS